jgi:hypothetical protein
MKVTSLTCEMKIDRTARLFVTVGQDRTWSSPRHVELLKIWQAGDAMVTHLMPWKRKCKGMDPNDPST